MTTRICVVGCGAIGGLFAAQLATLPEVEVWAFDTSAEHVAAINAGGLRLTGPIELTAPVQASADPAAIPPCEFGIVAVKGTATAAAIEATAPVFAAGAVCSVQNGIGNEELIARQVPRVMRGVTLSSGHLTEPGVIRLDAQGPTWIGPFEPAPATQAEVSRLGELLAAGGIDARVLADARGAQWTKLLFNSATNPLCALTGLSHGQLCELAGPRQVAGALISEGLAVADKLGITLDGDPAALVDSEAVANYRHRPSMLLDVLARRPTEIGTLNGGIVAAGREAGVPVPQHELVVALITGLERSWEAESGD